MVDWGKFPPLSRTAAPSASIDQTAGIFSPRRRRSDLGPAAGPRPDGGTICHLPFHGRVCPSGNSPLLYNRGTRCERKCHKHVCSQQAGHLLVRVLYEGDLAMIRFAGGGMRAHRLSLHSCALNTCGASGQVSTCMLAPWIAV